MPVVPLTTVLREWGRIGCVGFGGPPAHIRLLRQLVVERRGWLDAREFEDAIAVCNLMPGPASTQLAIFCAWRLRGRQGALVGGAAFIVPGLIVILALAVLFVATSPPSWVLGAGAGAGAAVPAVAVQAGSSLLGPSWKNKKAAVTAPRFNQIRGNTRARAFLDGAGPAAIGAILGSAVTLTRELTHTWQFAVLGGALVLMFALRRGVVLTLLSAAGIGVVIALAAGTVSP
jgi:chromate transporter